MYHIQADCESETVIKKSRFITYLHYTTSEEEAKAYIQAIKKMHPDANHHCYAFIIGEHDEIQRSNDDKEPSGTAGVPMLECLKQRKLQDILAITVRYFGGIKLGAGGLIRAYSGSVAQAIDEAVLTRKQTLKKCQISFAYDLIGKLDYFFRSEQIEVLDKLYEEQVTYLFLCQKIPQDEINELSSGTIAVQFIEDMIVDLPITQTHNEK